MEIATDASPRAAIYLLGPLVVRGPSGEINAGDLPGAKPRQLLECLALSHGVVVSKSRLIARLWPEDVPSEALPTLESYVSVLRQRLRRVAPGKDSVIRTVPAGYVIDRRSVWVDRSEFSELVERAALHDGGSDGLLLERALSMGDRTLLADEPEAEWAEQERASHRRRWVQVCIDAAAAAITAGRPAQAVRLADRALVADPLSERAWAVKVRALEAMGLESEALRVFMTCRTVLAEHLGCAPGNELQGLFWGLLHGASERADRWGDVVAAMLHIQEELAARERSLGGGPAGTRDMERACRVLTDLVRRVQVTPVAAAAV